MTNAVRTSDHDLIQRAAAGDRAAFEVIVRRYSRPLAEFVARRTARVQDAEDIVQETFLRAFSSLHTFDKQYSLKNWLFSIAYRLIVSGYRQKRPQPLEEADLPSAKCATTTQPMDDLWTIAEDLGGNFYMVLWLRYKQDMDISEIAHVMQKTQIAVRVLLHRARRRLAARLGYLAENNARGDWPRNWLTAERVKD